MKIELTIKTDYLPNWGAWEGIRELIQNGRDAELEHKAKLTVSRRGSALVVKNDGAVLPHEALLLGHSTKTGRADLAGQFGEGLKLGVLALVRLGHKVTIRSGSEVWSPKIARSERFDADVLLFEIVKGRKAERRVQVEVEGCDDELLNLIDSRFLFLREDRTSEVRVAGGSLLSGAEHRGAIFVKGIYVGHDPELRYGYDFEDADLDRDRRLLSRWDQNYRQQVIWRLAVSRRPDLVPAFGQLLADDAQDLAGIDACTASMISYDVVAALAADFVARHGEDAVPVGNLSESAEIGHLGKRGVVVPKGLRAVLEQKLGPLAAVQERLRSRPKKSYSWDELADGERASLERAIRLCAGVEPVSLDEIDVIDPQDEGVLGLYKAGRVQLAKKILSDRALTLRVLVHEVAHRDGDDGEKGHVARIEEIWSQIFERGCA